MTKQVTLSGMGLSGLPAEVMQAAEHVHVLDLHDNALEAVPELGQLTGLRRLHLGSNCLATAGVPDLAPCRQLSCLLLGSNRCALS